MRRSLSNSTRRAPALVVGVAALLLMSGCRCLPCFQKVSNPRVCPVCVAATPDQCRCFPDDLGAGYSETHWSTLASPDPHGSMFTFDHAASSTSPVTQVQHPAAAPIPEVVVERRRMSPPRELVELVKLAEPIEPAEVVQLAELAELVELAESVDLAELTRGDRD